MDAVERDRLIGTCKLCRDTNAHGTQYVLVHLEDLEELLEAWELKESLKKIFEIVGKEAGNERENKTKAPANPEGPEENRAVGKEEAVEGELGAEEGGCGEDFCEIDYGTDGEKELSRNEDHIQLPQMRTGADIFKTVQECDMPRVPPESWMGGL